MPVKFVEWDNKYNVGIKIVDDQHMRLIEITNELFEACTQDKFEMDKRFRETMKKAVDYVLVHFKDEESLMEKASYPKIKVHKSEHEEFIRKVLEAVKNYETGKQFVPNTFVRFLRDWLWDHIAISDREFGRFYLK
jgi:hemerythrin